MEFLEWHRLRLWGIGPRLQLGLAFRLLFHRKCTLAEFWKPRSTLEFGGDRTREVLAPSTVVLVFVCYPILMTFEAFFLTFSLVSYCDELGFNLVNWSFSRPTESSFGFYFCLGTRDSIMEFGTSSTPNPMTLQKPRSRGNEVCRWMPSRLMGSPGYQSTVLLVYRLWMS